MKAQLSRSVKAFQFGSVGNAKKRSHPGEAYVKRGWRKALCRRERKSLGLQGPHEEAEI